MKTKVTPAPYKSTPAGQTSRKRLSLPEGVRNIFLKLHAELDPGRHMPTTRAEAEDIAVKVEQVKQKWASLESFLAIKVKASDLV